MSKHKKRNIIVTKIKKSFTAVSKTIIDTVSTKIEKLPREISIKNKCIPTKPVILWAVALLLMLTVCTLIFTHLSGGEVFTLNGEGMCITDNRITEMLISNSKQGDFRKVKTFPAESRLYAKGSQYYIETGGKKQKLTLNEEYPVFLNNGAYLFLFNNRFELLNSKFDCLESEQGTFLSDGAVFKEGMIRQDGDNIIFLKLPNKLYINTQEIKIENQDKIDIISPNTILNLQETGIACYNISETKPRLKLISVIPNLTMIEVGNKIYTYEMFLEKLNLVNGDGNKSAGIDELRLNEDIYQYFMGKRYDYKGTKAFYRSKDGFVMEAAGEKFVIYSMPFYFTDERKILIPTDYVLVEPKIFSMKKLPALSEVYSDDNAVYTRTGEKIRTFTDMFMFDGNDSYIFFSSAKLSIGDKMIPITPFSNVSAGKDGTVEIYQYNTDEYRKYEAQGYKSVYVEMDNGVKVNLSTDILYQQSGKEQILFSKPSQLEEAA